MEAKNTMPGIETFTCSVCGEEKSVVERYETQNQYVCETHARSEQVEDVSDDAVSNENPLSTELARKFA